MNKPIVGMIGLLILSTACGKLNPSSGGKAESIAVGIVPATAFPNDKIAYDYFRAQQFSPVQAAAIVGNLDQESGIDPTISQDGGGPGRGIAQWSAGGRWDSAPDDNVLTYASQNNESPYALSTQLDFIMYELNTFPDYGLAKLRNSTDLNDATSDFELDFEGCGIPDECDLDARVGYANDVYAAYGDDPVDAGVPPDARTSPPSDAAAPTVADLATPSRDGATSVDTGSGQPTQGLGQAPAAMSSAGCDLSDGARERASAAWLAAAIALVSGLARRRRSR